MYLPMNRGDLVLLMKRTKIKSKNRSQLMRFWSSLINEFSEEPVQICSLVGVFLVLIHQTWT